MKARALIGLFLVVGLFFFPSEVNAQTPQQCTGNGQACFNSGSWNCPNFDCETLVCRSYGQTQCSDGCPTCYDCTSYSVACWCTPLSEFVNIFICNSRLCNP